MRTEIDFIGKIEIDDSIYYGIHTFRARSNFDVLRRPFHRELIKAITIVKKAACITNQFLELIPKKKAEAVIEACDRVIDGKFEEQFVIDALQGGAGTSANMNVNEVIANIALEILGEKKGNYEIIHPIDHVNMSQSTNDVFPTAVRIAAINLLKPVTEGYANLQTALQNKENEFADILKVGRTQLQDAVPVLLGQEFGAWAQAISRDRWRLYKAEERLRQVNIGGTAIGTGVNTNVKYIYIVIEKLRELTGLGLARAEYMMDPTQNCDVFVEVSGLLKTSVLNLSKISNDLRLMSSGPRAGLGEIMLPKVQAGSSIMPGKVNPVIPEMINQIAFQVMGNDLTISMAAQSGQLELNPFLPVIAHNLFEMLDIVNRGLKSFISKCIIGIKANKEKCDLDIKESFVLITMLSNYIGYDKATKILKLCLDENKGIVEIVERENILDKSQIEKIFNPYEMTKPGIPGERSDVK
ncbi:MAG: aspartate ammonia-lyase [Clostridiales bacterium]